LTFQDALVQNFSAYHEGVYGRGHSLVIWLKSQNVVDINFSKSQTMLSLTKYVENVSISRISNQYHQIHYDTYFCIVYICIVDIDNFLNKPGQSW
jgi:hypothetical protein